MSQPTRTYQLVEDRLGKSLAEYARERRQGGDSWHAITIAIAASTSVAVTPETLRIWLSREPGMERVRQDRPA